MASEPEAARPVFFFVHIPKTGGQTVRQHFARNMRSRMVSVNSKGDRSKEALGALDSAQKNQIDLVVGHRVRFDLAEYFPQREARFFTVLREPVSLVISRYNYHCFQAGEQPSFEDWFKPPRHNLTCRWLLTVFLERQAQAIRSRSEDELYQQARELLGRFWRVASLERLEETLSPVFGALSVSRTIAEKVNVAGRDYPKLLQRSPGLEDKILSRVGADVRLYEDFCRATAS